jgi:monoterpene epsilon-lactone hydrolase
VTGSSRSDVDAAIGRIKTTYGGWVRGTPIARMREDWDQLFRVDDLKATLESVDADGVPAMWVSAANVGAGRAILYLHGGGFQVGSANSHAELMACLSRATGCRVLGVNYRLAPEHTYPAALRDTRTAYEWLLTQKRSANHCALAGDSAGANLVLLLLLALRDEGRLMPAAAALLSPWTDLTAGGESYSTRSASDPIHQRPMVLALARSYLGPAIDARSPAVSPLFADMRGLPPLLIQVGDRETLLSDSVALADIARERGVIVELEVWKDMFHVFQQFPRDLIEARDAIAVIGRFLNQRLDL